MMIEGRELLLTQKARELVTGTEVAGDEGGEGNAIHAARVTLRGEQATGTVAEDRALHAGFCDVGTEQCLQSYDVLFAQESNCIVGAHELRRERAWARVMGERIRDVGAWAPALPLAARSRSVSIRCRIWDARRRSMVRSSHAMKSRSVRASSTVAARPAM